jgi:hypothetical protein
MLYAKIHNHLHCFGSRFTKKSPDPDSTRDFYAVMFGPIRRYETDLQFTLKFVLIYAGLVHVLR